MLKMLNFSILTLRNGRNNCELERELKAKTKECDDLQSHGFFNVNDDDVVD